MTQLNSKVSQRVILGISKGKKGIQWNVCADFKAESYRSRTKITNILTFHSSPIHHIDRAKLGVSRQNWCVEEDLNETSKYLRRLGDSDQSNNFQLCHLRKHFAIIWQAYLQVNLCHKFLFLHHLTQNMTIDCSSNYKFNTRKFRSQTWGEHIVCRNCFWHSEQFLYTTYSPPCSAKRRVSDKDLPL